MRFELHRDPARFQRQAGSLLEGRIECNVMATILTGILEGRYEEAIFAVGLEGDLVGWAAFRTPPYGILAAPGLPAAQAGELADGWLEEDPEAPGVNSVPDVSRSLIAALAERTGRSTRLRMGMAMHVLEEVLDLPRPAPGRLRRAGHGDRPLLVEWWRAFQEEAGVPDVGLAGLDSRLDAGGVHVWEVEGEPVSLVAHAPAVARVARIGPVYTPAPLRGRGYASSAVAAISRQVLAEAAERCMLYTDLCNPTSNKIYAEVGYRRVADWEEHELA